jgi:hypothetical protein
MLSSSQTPNNVVFTGSWWNLQHPDYWVLQLILIEKNAPFSVSQCAVIFRKVTPVSNETLLHYFTVSAHHWKKRASDHYTAKMTATDTIKQNNVQVIFPLQL